MRVLFRCVVVFTCFKNNKSKSTANFPRSSVKNEGTVKSLVEKMREIPIKIRIEANKKAQKVVKCRISGETKQQVGNNLVFFQC